MTDRLIIEALTLLVQLSVVFRETTVLIREAKQAGRDLTLEEMTAINDKYDKSFSDLRKAIEAKQ